MWTQILIIKPRPFQKNSILLGSFLFNFVTKTIQKNIISHVQSRVCSTRSGIWFSMCILSYRNFLMDQKNPELVSGLYKKRKYHLLVILVLCASRFPPTSSGGCREAQAPYPSWSMDTPKLKKWKRGRKKGRNKKRREMSPLFMLAGFAPIYSLYSMLLAS